MPVTPATSTIDMLTPVEVCQRLDVAESQLIELVNRGALPAYNLAGHIRFKVGDVKKITAALVAA